MSGITHGPLPSRHIFLHEIAKQPTATKVRFLGCVASYDVLTALLVLEHAYPQDLPQVPRVSVDLSLVLESLRPDQLQSGTWLNIIGYVSKCAPTKNRVPVPGRMSMGTGRSSIQALVVWNAGALRIGDYEKILSQQQNMRKQLQTEI
ncbi:hypothetical protein GJ744_000324 [Endocarpon pusillum]|uniref:CST complex subunit Ten1 n=1 Tax=Endocarpon pusillum TaxID=364733 RepID=A0A8H7E851_9EURO|nr:hypothetical protein GJ744_000324 [Endocarpon pusillum]